MKKYLILPLLFAMLAGPVQAAHRALSVQDMVTWAGCKANLVTSDEESVASSFYVPVERTLYIGTQSDPSIPEYVHTMILLHEVGHCLQHQQGYVFEMAVVERELDADRISVDLACAMGMDGRTMIHDVFMWAYESFGYQGDYAHGTSAERIAQRDKARWCDKRVEAPWAI